tara:strand:- start:8951 stop:9547 length:597 start_codon:yes stop_codon:yes gene_type:complete
VRLSEARKDHFRKLAKREGYPSRSAYKIIEINKKYRLIRSGSVVLDLGSSPGGWLSVVCNHVGPRGFALGVDIRPSDNLPKNANVAILDVTSDTFEESILDLLPRTADVILSDLSPNITGIWQMDHLKQIDLTKHVIKLFPNILAPEGSAVLKVFEGEALKDLVDSIRLDFERVEIAKPLASRAASSEFYLVCRSYRR